MKKYILSILVGFLSFLGLTLGVNAESAPSTFKTEDVIKLTEYVPGIVNYYKPIADGLEVFCEDAGLTYVTGITYKLKGQVNDGYIYIFENRPNTGDKYKDYYIQSVAIWWYKDYLNGTNANLTTAQKNYIFNNRNSNEVCRLIYILFEGAKNYKQVKGSMTFSDGNVTFTESNGYYVSDKITLSTVRLIGGGKLDLVNAPTGSSLINSTIDKYGNGTFQIKVPKSAVNPGQTVTFSVKASGNYSVKKMYDYYLEKNPNNQNEYQQVIYGKVFTNAIAMSGSKTITLSRATNKLSITKVDNDTNTALAGATLVLYKGNCANTTCESKNEYATWTSTTSAKEFTNVPVGTYTLVETKAPNGYLVANKQVINVTSESGNYNVTMKDVKAHNKLTVLKIDQDNKALAGAGFTLYKGNCASAACDSANSYATWTSTTSAKEFNDIPVGTYTLVETKVPAGYRQAAKMVINIDSNNKTYNYKITNTKNSSVRISKTDLTGQNEIPGAKLVLKNAAKTVVEEWVSTNTPHYIVLAPGEYFLTETVAPKGYVLSTDTINFKVDESNKIYEKNANGEWVLTDYIKMVNEPEVKEYKVRISKTDVTGQNEVAGASLVLKNESGKEVASWVSTTEPHYETLIPGVYTLTETIAPKGYILSKSSITFKVDVDGNVFEQNSNKDWVKVSYVKMVNLSKEAININKLDSETNEYVAGATLRIKNSKGEVIATFTTTKESYYLSLEEGEYSLEEVSAPKGYIINNKPVYFKVDADANVYTVDSKGEYVLANGIIMYNEPEKIEIPATGLTSTLTYVLGTAVLGFGAIMLYRNEKKC